MQLQIILLMSVISIVLNACLLNNQDFATQSQNCQSPNPNAPECTMPEGILGSPVGKDRVNISKFLLKSCHVSYILNFIY